MFYKRQMVVCAGCVIVCCYITTERFCLFLFFIFTAYPAGLMTDSHFIDIPASPQIWLIQGLSVMVVLWSEVVESESKCHPRIPLQMSYSWMHSRYLEITRVFV
jgi:hypothetical protein